jgi:hypothetical protein
MCVYAGALVERPNGGGGMRNGQFITFNRWYHSSDKEHKSGMPDLKVFFAGHAPLVVEIKRDAKDKLSASQVEYFAAAQAVGMETVVVTMVHDLISHFATRNIEIAKRLIEARNYYGYY